MRTASARPLIARDRRVHYNAPGIDASGHALARRHTLIAEPIHDVQAAYAVVAEDDQRVVVGFGLEILQAFGDAPHRDQRGAFNKSDRKFVRLTNVDEHQLLPRVDAALDVLRADLKWEDCFAHESRIAQTIAIRLDADLLAWLRSQKGYQTRINAVLRTFMQASRRRAG